MPAPSPPGVLEGLFHSSREHWSEGLPPEPDFNGVRGPDALAKLPEAGRRKWQKLWADVADTLARSKGGATPQKQSHVK
jgi:hypothetical protein